MDRMRYSHRIIPAGCFILFIALFFSFIILPTVTSASEPQGEKQVGVFGVEENAQALRNRLESEGEYAFLRKKEVGGKTLYAVIVRVREEATVPAEVSPEVQVGVFGVEENAQNLRNQLEQEGKYAFLRKKEVGGKTLYAVIVRVSEEAPAFEAASKEAVEPEQEAMADEAAAPAKELTEIEALMEEAAALADKVLADEAPAPPAEPMETSVEMEQADADMMEDEAPMPAEPAEEPTYMDSPAVSHPVDVAAQAPSPAPPAREEEPPVESQFIPIKGIGVVFDIHIKGRSRIYEEPSFRSRRVGYKRDVGDVQVVSETRSGWIVVKGFVNDKFMYVPGDDVTYFSLDKKGRREKRLKERPEVK